MRKLLLALGLGLLVAGSAFAGGPAQEEEYPPQQQVGKVVVIDNSGDSNTAVWVALVGGAATLGAAYIGVRANRKR